MKAKFHLVDLAGSERQKKTRAEGNTFQEGVKINGGLLVLGNVISALCDNLPHIPYRNSKLTRLLQDSLGGNSHTVMIACVSPADDNYEETLNTLRYADRARKIKNKPVINQDPQQLLIARLQAELDQLKLKLQQRRSSIGLVASPKADQLDMLKEENETLKTHLQEAWQQVTEAEEKKIMTEVANDRLKQKLRELHAHSNQALSQTFTEGVIPEPLQVQIRSIQAKVVELQEVHKENEKNLVNNTFNVSEDHAGEEPVEEDHDESHEEDEEPHINKQAHFNHRIQEINKQLREKEHFLSQLREKDEKWNRLQKQYESDLLTLQHKVEELNKEKIALLHAKDDKASAGSTEALRKLAEQRRKRVAELEQLISDSKQKIKEKNKMLQIQKRDKDLLEKMQKEIGEMKRMRVKLIKQMKEEGERFRKFRQQKEKEICRLKQESRKQEYQQKKKERMYDKQKVVLMRKMEEAQATNKRLKDALAKQKSAQERRNVESKGSSQHSKLMEWLTGEIEVAVSIREAERNVEELLQDRRELNKQLNDLQRSNCTSTPTSASDLKNEIALRTSQIDDLRHRIDASHEEVTRNTRWDHIKILGEAKVVLRSLLDVVVEARCNSSSLDRIRSTLNHELREANEMIKRKDEHMEEFKKLKEGEMMEIRREYEGKICWMLDDLQNKNLSTESISDESKRLVELQKGQLEKLRAQLDEEKQKRQRLEQVSATRPKSRKTKMPATPDSPDFDALGDSTEEEDNGSDRENDPDWKATPIYHRLKRIKEQSMLHAQKSSTEMCKCRGGCGTKQCKCKKGGRSCSTACKCRDCKNQGDSSMESEGSLNGTFVSASDGSGSGSFGDGTFIKKRRSSEDAGQVKKSRKLTNLTNVRFTNSQDF